MDTKLLKPLGISYGGDVLVLAGGKIAAPVTFLSGKAASDELDWCFSKVMICKTKFRFLG